MVIKNPSLKKFKVGQNLFIKFIDIHSNSNGWTTREGGLKDTPCYVDVYGEYLGISESGQAVLGTMINYDGGYETKYGVRIYIPVGCIISIKRIK